MHPWPSEVWVGWLFCPCIVLEPIKEMSSHLSGQGVFVHSHLSFAEPLWTDPALKSGTGLHELISTLKKKKRHRQGVIWLILSQKSSLAKKKPLPSPSRTKVGSIQSVAGFGTSNPAVPWTYQKKDGMTAVVSFMIMMGEPRLQTPRKTKRRRMPARLQLPTRWRMAEPVQQRPMAW